MLFTGPTDRCGGPGLLWTLASCPLPSDIPTDIGGTVASLEDLRLNPVVAHDTKESGFHKTCAEKERRAQNAYNWFCELIRTPTSKGIRDSVFQYLITTTLIQTGLINFRIRFNTPGVIRINMSTASLMQYINLFCYFLICVV